MLGQIACIGQGIICRISAPRSLSFHRRSSEIFPLKRYACAQMLFESSFNLSGQGATLRNLRRTPLCVVAIVPRFLRQMFMQDVSGIEQFTKIIFLLDEEELPVMLLCCTIPTSSPPRDLRRKRTSKAQIETHGL
jgi:hypothetical protein